MGAQKGKDKIAAVAETPEVVVGTGKKKSWMPNWKFLVSIVVVLVLALTAGVLLRWWQDRGKPAIKKLPAVIDDSQRLALDGDYKGAHERLNEELKKDNLSTQQKYEVYFQQGTTYNNEGKYKEALESYKKAASFKETTSLANAMATLYEMQDDKVNAAKYYRLAAKLVPTDSPIAEDDKAAFEMKAKALETQP